MVNVATGHEHTFGVKLDVLAAHCAHRRLQRPVYLFAMLLINFYHWQLVDRILLGLLLDPVGFGFSLAYSSDHLEEVITAEVLIKVRHELSRIKLCVGVRHPHKLSIIKGRLEHAHHIIDEGVDHRSHVRWISIRTLAVGIL